eukprot:6341500-Pyramimonas_sp.AAC.1
MFVFCTQEPPQRPPGPPSRSPGRRFLDPLGAQFGRSGSLFASHGDPSPSWGPRGALCDYVGILRWPPRGSWVLSGAVLELSCAA